MNTFLQRLADSARAEAEPPRATYDRLLAKAAADPAGDLTGADADLMERAMGTLGIRADQFAADVAERRRRSAYLVHDLRDKPDEWGDAGTKHVAIETVLANPEWFPADRWRWLQAPGQEPAEFARLVAMAGKAVASAGGGPGPRAHAYLLPDAAHGLKPLNASPRERLVWYVAGVEDQSHPNDPDAFVFMVYPGQTPAALAKLLERWRSHYLRRMRPSDVRHHYATAAR